MDCELLCNGRIVALRRGGYAVHGAAVVQGGVVLALGEEAELAAVYAWAARRDLGGRVVLPGFNDAHMHFVSLLVQELLVDLAGAPDAEAAVAAAAAAGAGPLVCVNYGGAPGARLDLERLARPVLVLRVCQHAALCNAAFLALAGLAADAAGPGHAVLLEGAVARAWDAGVRLGVGPRALRARALALMRRLNARGLTSVQSDDFGHLAALQPAGRARGRAELGAAFLDAMAAAAPRMTLRYTEQASFREPAECEAFLAAAAARLRRPGPQRLFTGITLGPVKVLLDGALGPRTALLRADYADAPGARGRRNLDAAALGRVVAACRRAGAQLLVHAIGDGAAEAALDALAARPAPAARDCLVHFQVAAPGQAARAAALGVGAIVQPAFVATDGFYRARLGERAGWAYPLRSLLRAGVAVALSSDAPAGPPDPALALRAAVERAGADGAPVNPEEAVGLMEAVEAFTLGAARAEHQDEAKGSLQPLTAADYVVLGPGRLETYFAGRRVYDGPYAGDQDAYAWLVAALDAALSGTRA